MKRMIAKEMHVCHHHPVCMRSVQSVHRLTLRWLWPRHAFRAFLLQPFFSSGNSVIDLCFDAICFSILSYSVAWETPTKFAQYASALIARFEFSSSSAPAISEACQVFEMKKSLEIPGDLHEQFFRYRASLAFSSILTFVTQISQRLIRRFQNCVRFFRKGCLYSALKMLIVV